MSRAFRHKALGRHPALNRLPRDFLTGVGLTLLPFFPNAIFERTGQ